MNLDAFHGSQLKGKGLKFLNDIKVGTRSWENESPV